MSPIAAAWREYREAVGAFSRPGRLFLLSTLLGWSGFGVHQVLFNLYLVEAGFQEAFVGRTIALNALGLALAALPAGWLAERRSRRLCIVLGGGLEGAGLLLRAIVVSPGAIYLGSFLSGAGQALVAIAAAPFLTEHSEARERTHLFSAYFAAGIVAGVLGSLLGGLLPAALLRLGPGAGVGTLLAFRATLVVGALLPLASILPMARLRGLPESPLVHPSAPIPHAEIRKLRPIVVNAFCIGAGAGLVIPFMNLYFQSRFACSSAQIGIFFSVAQLFTAAATLIGPAVARHAGKLRTATASQALSLPFLVTLGLEQRLSWAVGAFWMRAALMQASTPLLGAFVMEVLPPALRARSASLTNLVWNVGWAVSATGSGLLIQRFGYAVPFYVTAALYGFAAWWFYASFRNTREDAAGTRLSEEAKGRRGEGPMTE